jgi:hypothetical protein
MEVNIVSKEKELHWSIFPQTLFMTEIKQNLYQTIQKLRLHVKYPLFLSDFN